MKNRVYILLLLLQLSLLSVSAKEITLEYYLPDNTSYLSEIRAGG